MQIEPEALYGLFDTIIIHSEKKDALEAMVQSETLINRENPIKKLRLIFKSEPLEEEEILLNKILNAIQIMPDETERLISLSNETLVDQLDSSIQLTLIWGINLEGIHKYKIVRRNQTDLLLSDELGVIASDQSLKSKLWNCLKSKFIGG